jgi:glycine cleavage system H protein
VSQPTDLLYTESHEWVRVDTDGTCTVGISDHAQDALGELVYVELPDIGATVARGENCAVVESTKAASDVYAPLDGEVVAVNESLADSPQLVNEAAFGDGWLFRIKPANPDQKNELLNAADYEKGLDQ